MFRKFLDFVKEEKQYDFESSEQFLKTMGGKSFLNGMYRIFDEKSIPKWNDIVGKSFPKYKNHRCIAPQSSQIPASAYSLPEEAPALRVRYKKGSYSLFTFISFLYAKIEN